MNNDTKKGVFLGILITIAAILVINTAQIGYRVLIKKKSITKQRKRQYITL